VTIAVVGLVCALFLRPAAITPQDDGDVVAAPAGPPEPVLRTAEPAG
jgi:hypothetical protein